MSVNKVILVGNCGQNPSIRKTQDGADIANFSLATSEYWRDKRTGEKKSITEWHYVVVFGQLATVVKNYVKKGSKLYIEGQLKTREWTDKEGIKRYTTEVVLSNYSSKIDLLDSKKDSELKGKDFVDQAQKDHDATYNKVGLNDLDNHVQFDETLDDEIAF